MIPAIIDAHFNHPPERERAGPFGGDAEFVCVGGGGIASWYQQIRFATNQYRKIDCPAVATDSWEQPEITTGPDTSDPVRLDPVRVSDSYDPQ